MDCSLSNSKSETITGISVAVILVSCASVCNSIQCDVKKEYQLVQNKMSREILKCLKCGPCKPGFELEPPCGSVVGVADKIRICNPCKDGFYSGNEDMLQCQQCQSETCFAHQIVVGICKKDKPDTSRCTGCQKGYVMNSDATACVVDKQQTTTDLSTVTTKGPTLSNKTDGETGLSVAKTGLSVVEIILIVIGSLLIVVIVCLCCYCNCRNSRHTQRGKIDEENSSANTSTTLLNETKDEGNRTIILQEEDQCNGLHSTSDGLHLKETTAGFVDSSPSNNAGNYFSGTVMGYTPPLNNFVANNGRAMSSAPLMQNNSQPESLILQRAPAAVAPNYLQVNDPHLTRFGGLSFQTYDEICVTFDAGPPGKDWRALAGWLVLKVEVVDQIGMKEDKTNQVIKTWAVETKNTVARFVQILEDEKHGMTYLADKIKAELKILHHKYLSC